MRKQCIYCPKEYTEPESATRYGICPSCARLKVASEARSDVAILVGLELAALTESDPKEVLRGVLKSARTATVRLRGAA